jgi:outer membrane beta-barrel protein
MRKNTLFISTLILCCIFLLQTANAEDADDLEVINLEGIYQNSPATRPTEVKSNFVNSSSVNELEQQVDGAPDTTIEATESVEKTASSKNDIKVGELKDLSRLSPFREVSVIQKKYLPKTERFQFYGALTTTTNTPWFLNYGARLGLSYHFTEAFGLELSGLFLSSSERQVASEIRENNGLRPEQFIYTKGFYGIDIIWSPIYGKLSHLDGSIVPFDMYFSLGGGMSNTNSREGDVGTLHIGTGQIFAITKSIAFRWDYSLNVFQATPNSSSTTAAPAKGSYNDLVLSAGFSFFFPEASLR